MNWFWLQTIAQISVERLLNALPEGFVIAFFVWAMLRVLNKQNSGTRFAVWFLALLTVAALPVLEGLGEGRALIVAENAPFFSSSMRSVMSSLISPARLRSAVTVPGSWALFLFAAWAIGVSIAMLHLVTGLWRLRQLRRSCTTIVPAELDPMVSKTVNMIAASGSVAIATSECVRVPAAIGFWKRTIVLPAWALRELAPEDLNVVLLHEFAHLRRWDDWTNLMQKIVRSVFFFHPAVWWIENRLSVEREMACDDAVLAETAKPLAYATCLVSLLEKSLAHRLTDKSWGMAQAAVHRAREASLRLARILDTKGPVTTGVWKPALGMVSAFSIVCLMALPLAPQFVAFDSGRPAGNSNHAHTAAIMRPSIQSMSHDATFQTTAPARATVIPASFRTGKSPFESSSSAGITATNHRAHVSAIPVANHSVNDGNRSAALQTRTARLNGALRLNRAVSVRADSNQESMPQFQRLVLIEATQYLNSGSTNSMVWRVQIWQVTVVSAWRGHSAVAMVAHSI